ncbi:MAG: response regulator [Candidatus Omnitrophota bacterium]
MDKKKILVVDDEVGIVDVMQKRLTHEGYEVITATDGEEGLKKARSEKPDLVLLDIFMPKMSGKEVLAALKSGLDTKSIPVIMITGMGDVEEIVKYMTEGKAEDYIVKPFFTEDLSTKIYSALFAEVDKKVKRTLEK